MQKPYGWPSEGEREVGEKQGWVYSAHQVAPGIYTTRAEYNGHVIYYWPPTDHDFGSWRLSPPTVAWVKNSIPYRQRAGIMEVAVAPIYTTGYGNRSAAALFEAVKAIRGYLVDIRYWPHSRSRMEWGRAELQKRFGSRYLHCGALGNTARGTGEIKIWRMDEGIADLEWLIEQGKTPPVLLCACGRADTCHRSVVAEELRKRGHRTMELEWTVTPVEVATK